MILAIATVILILAFLFLPAVPFDKEISSVNMVPPLSMEVRGYGSMSYYLFGIGSAPFAGTLTFKEIRNGILFEVVMTDGSPSWFISMPELKSPPLADVSLQLRVNVTTFSGSNYNLSTSIPLNSSTLFISFRNTGDSNITQIVATAAFAKGIIGGDQVNVPPNGIETIAFTTYVIPPPTIGAMYPVTITGSVVNGSQFSLDATVLATKA